MEKQFVIQITKDTGKLLKSYQVSERYPIRQNIPDNVDQYILTDEEEYDKIVQAYRETNALGSEVYFFLNETTQKIDWIIPDSKLN